ncbi:cyclic AMP-dependent transcription factor ATF-6 alpha-like [Oppia nitens]|uniref:cyclic AMP-dependent transcription factor ATF-6 alpha-like n=1 Tax=Oppia nitens TaxID=1686743 RepID=UPI0023DC6890|nr:cyclic AMP-dependent transcription factor ATF-6 alpha-like [Oppia nitens]
MTMSELMSPMIDHLLTANGCGGDDDDFMADNMLTDDDLDVDLDPCLLADLLATDFNGNHSLIQTTTPTTMEQTLMLMTTNAQDMMCSTMSAPDTPPSSDRSTPPNFDDLLMTATQPTIKPLPPPQSIPLLPTSHDMISIQNGHQQQPLASQLTLIPAAINLCHIACPLSPLSPPAVITTSTTQPLHSPTLAINSSSNDNNNMKLLLTNNIINNNRSSTIKSSKSSSVELSSQLKREARKLRNREAATISRKRQKEYVQSLENSVNGLIQENSRLKSDNDCLRKRLAELENNCNTINSKKDYMFVESNCKCRLSSSSLTSTSGSNKKAALSLLAVVFMLGLNLAPFSGILITTNTVGETNRRLDGPRHGPSRSLLWDSAADDGNTIDSDIVTLNNTGKYANNSRQSYTNCKTLYINQTESIRLATDLRDWMSRVEMEKQVVFNYKKKRLMSQLKSNTNHNNNDNKLKNRFNKPIPLARLKAWIQKRTESSGVFNDLNDYTIDDYYYNYDKRNAKLPQINYDDLLAAIHRRDDTFYLLSYSSKDHLIIPAIIRQNTTSSTTSGGNSDIRPRFSLLMPLISTLNASTIRGTNITYNQMSIMQIDCQVINTKMVLFNSKTTNGKTSSSDQLMDIRNRNNNSNTNNNITAKPIGARNKTLNNNITQN